MSSPASATPTPPDLNRNDAGPWGTQSDIADLLDAALAGSSVPGAALAVLRDGTLTTASAGVACHGGPDMSPHHQFPIMSLTKGVTAMAAVSCAREG